MIDIREELYSLLSSNYTNVYHGGVDDFSDNLFPKINYQISNNYDLDFRDGEPTINASIFNVQVFSKAIDGELVEVHEEVIKLLKDNGYKREYYTYTVDKIEALFIHTFVVKKYKFY